MKIAVVMGGDSAEREVSVHTGHGIAKAISRGHTVTEMIIDAFTSDTIEKLSDYKLVFNALHGGFGENGEVQKRLDEAGLTYTGSGPEASRLAMDKNQSKILAGENGILTPDWEMLDTADGEGAVKSIGIPCVVKPNAEGSTFGLSVVNRREDMAAAIAFASEYTHEVMVEKYIPGRELTVGILGDRALPVVEIIPRHGLYDYECKYTGGMSSYVCPAELDSGLTEFVQLAALQMHRLLGCRHYARADFRFDGDQIYFLEMNTLPGMTGTSLLPKAAKADGLSYEQLIEEIIRLAMEKK